MKRSSDSSLPTPESKYPRQEISSPPQAKLDHMCDDLRRAGIAHDSTDEFLNSCLMEIHSAVRSSIASHRDETLVYRFTPRDKFEKIVRRHSDFFPLVRKLAQGFKKDDVHALITHGVCTFIFG